MGFEFIFLGAAVISGVVGVAGYLIGTGTSSF